MFVLIFVLCTGVVLAQTTSGSITGTVVDSQQATVTGAQVTVTEEGKSYSLTAVTDGEGRFVFPIVPPGIYSLNKYQAYLRKLLTRPGCVNTFEDLNKELYIPAIHLDMGDLVLFGTPGWRDVAISDAIAALKANRRASCVRGRRSMANTTRVPRTRAAAIEPSAISLPRGVTPLFESVELMRATGATAQTSWRSLWKGVRRAALATR